MSNNYNYTDTTPYLLRQTGNGDITVYGTNREDDTLVGATVRMNQQIKTLDQVSSFQAVTRTYADGVATYTPTDYSFSSKGWYTTSAQFRTMLNHVYFATCDIYPDNDGLFKFGYDASPNKPLSAGKYTTIEHIAKPGPKKALVLYLTSTDWTSGSFKAKDCMCIDLTAMLGSTIADYLYSLESATAGAGVAKLKEWGFLTEAYYEYNPGTLESVQATAHKMTGFNQWNEEWESGTINTSGAKVADPNYIRSKNYVPVLPNTQYFLKTGSALHRIFFYDADKNFISFSYGTTSAGKAYTTPDNCYYVMFRPESTYGTTYQDNICLNLSSFRNGEYEPYVSHIYDLGTDTLRGLFKLDSENRLVADGDTKTSDGVITRKYGVVDLGTLTWGKGNTQSGHWRFTANMPNAKPSASASSVPNMICTKYIIVSPNDTWVGTTGVTINNTSNLVMVCDEAYADAASFKTAMSGVMLVYELATPTTEQSTLFTSSQICDPDGTEEYLTSNGVPVGHVTSYFVGETEIVEPTIEHVLDYNGLAYLWTRLKQRFSSAINLVNGNATGSLRNVYSNSQYTMGNTATALGYQSKSSGPYSLSEGEYTVASGEASHAEGSNTTASGLYSHSQGSGTIASGVAQTALGQFNVSDSDNVYAIILGNGLQNSSRSNALTVDWNGNVFIQGDVQTSASEVVFQSTPAYPSTARSHSFWMYDSSGTKTEAHRIAGYQAYIGATGNVYSSLYAYKSDGSADKACIEAVYKNSDGTKYIAANCDVNVTGGISATSNASINGTLTTGSFIYAGGTANQATNHVEIGTNGIEIYHSTPFIDFHFGNSTADHTSRIIERSSGTLSVTSALSVESTLSVGSTLKTSGVIYTGAKTTSTAGTGCYIGTDGTMALQSTTTDSNAYGATNPHITFLNSNASQNIQLIFTDFDSVQAPASLTLAGNQGGEYFIAPNIKATGGIYVGDTNSNFVHIFPRAVDAIGDGSTSAWLQAKQSTNNAIYIQAEVDGQVTLGSKGANNTYYTILKRRNNAHDIDIFGNWYVNTAFILLNNHWIYYADSSGTNRILTGANSDNDVFFGYGSYVGNTGNVYLDGNTVYLRSKNNIYFYGTTTAQVTSNGNFQSGASSSTGGHFFKVWNNKKQGSLYADTSGNLGIYCDTHKKWLIYINSSGTVVANTSDIRYKENVSTMPESDALSILREIDIINFSYKEDEEHLMQSGVSAQQLRDVVLKHGIKEHAYITMGSAIEGDTSVYTDITMPDKDIRYEIDYGKLVPVIWKGWQYQDKRIKELEAKIEQLSQENEQLKQRIEAMA